MNAKKGSLKKNLSAIVALACVVSLALSGTYAWVNRSQHKTNKAIGGEELGYDVRLIDVYSPKQNWKSTDPDVTKEIRVSNPGKEVEGYGPVYVRLALKEYMEIGKRSTTETEVRYMVDGNGRFVHYQSYDVAATAHSGHTITQLTDAVTGDNGYFIQTKAGDPNGQYGAFVTTSITTDAVESLVSGVVKADDDARDKHQERPNGECDYTIHKWNGNSLNTDEVFRQYVSWTLGSNVIRLSAWDGEPVAKWILDDRDVNAPMAYWGQALQPEATTYNLLESIKLISDPDGSFYYVIHVDMDAASIDDLKTWTDAPQKIIDSYGPGAGGGQGSAFSFNNAPSTVKIGETVAGPTVTFDPDDQSNSVTWTSSDTLVATVNPSTGEVTGVASGTATITATDINENTLSYELTVTDIGTPPIPGGYLAVNTPSGGFTPPAGAEVEISAYNTDPQDGEYRVDKSKDGFIPLSTVIKNFDSTKPVTISFDGIYSKYQSTIKIGIIPSANNTAGYAGEQGIILSYLPDRSEAQAALTSLSLPVFKIQANLTQDGKTTENPITINITYEGIIS